MSTDSKSIKFPEKHYVGFQSRPSQDEVPLGFMTPFGTDKAFDKRKDTVDRWAASSGYYSDNVATDKLPAQTYENNPMCGFKLGRNVRHGYGWGQGNVKWRIEDPRGFELEISSPNLAQILAFCTIESGEILEDCIWARMGAENILVPVNSDVYKASARNTARMAKKASMRDLKIGDTAILHNGEEGIYYGTFYIINTNQYSQAGCHTVSSTGKKRHIFLMQTSSSTKFFRAISSPKLAELMDGTPMTHQQAEAEVNRLIQSGTSVHESNSSYDTPIAVSIEELKDLNFVRTEEKITYDDLIDRIKKKQPEQSSNLHYLLRYGVDGTAYSEFKGRPVIVPVYELHEQLCILPGGINHNPNYHTKSSYTCGFPELDADEWDNGNIKPIVIQKTSGTGYWSRRYDESKTVDFDVTTDTIPELTMFKMCAKTKAGTEIFYYL